jgi:hypothetical protein
MGFARGASRRVRHVRIAFATGKEIGKKWGEVLMALQEHVRVELILCHQVQECDN